MGFDIGMLVANFLMAYFSQPGYREKEDLNSYQEWILTLIEGIFESFTAEFSLLWNTERTGILFPKSLFEDQNQSSDGALKWMNSHIWNDAMRICGIEMHRRTLSLAHNADFEEIKDETQRAPLEARNLLMGRELILNGPELSGPRALCDVARQFNKEDLL